MDRSAAVHLQFMTIDGFGNIHSDSNGRFVGHVYTEGDADEVLADADTARSATFSADLAAGVGGKITETGGGCQAIQVRLPGAGELLITNGDAELPDGRRALIHMVDLHGVAEDKVYEMDGPLDVAALATQVKVAAGEWNAAHPHCDPDRLRADLEAADPNGTLLSPAQRDSLVELSRVLEGQPEVSMNPGCGVWAFAQLQLPPTGTPGKLTKVWADFATQEATRPREMGFRSEWELPGTDWSNGVLMECVPGEPVDPDHVRATVARLGQIQARCDEEANRPGIEHNPNDGYERFTSMFVSHQYGQTRLNVTPNGGRSATLIVDGDRISNALVNTDYGAINVTGDELRSVVMGRICQGLWLDASMQGRTEQRAPDSPEQLQAKLLGF